MEWRKDDYLITDDNSKVQLDIVPACLKKRGVRYRLEVQAVASVSVHRKACLNRLLRR